MIVYWCVKAQSIHYSGTSTMVAFRLFPVIRILRNYYVKKYAKIWMFLMFSNRMVLLILLRKKFAV